MTPRDAIGVACVLWPGLRGPLALVDLVGEALRGVRVDDAGQLEIGDRVLVTGRADRRRWALGAFVETSSWDSTVSVALGPLYACLIIDCRADEGGDLAAAMIGQAA